MKVNIEAQWLCAPQQSLRGVHSYTVNIIKSLVARNKNRYSISFFDHNRERGNRKYMIDYIDEGTLRNLDIFECNSISYKTITDANIAGNPSIYDNIPYSGYTGAKADVYHFPFPYSIPFNVDGSAVVTVHDIIPILPSFRKILKNFIRTTLNDFMLTSLDTSMRYMEKRKNIVIIADSESTKNDIATYSSISPERVHVVPLAYDRYIHFPECNAGVLSAMGIDAPYLLYLGSLDFHKGVVDIIDSFEILKPKFREVKLVLAGKLSPSVKPIHDRLARCRYKDSVILTGYVNDEQKRALLSSASVFLFPSEYEGFGLPVLEAMACGSPVITTNVSSLPEVGGDAAVYVSPRNPEQLAFEIERLLSSDSLRDECIQKGFEQSSKFSWDKTAAMTEEVYEIASRG